MKSQALDAKENLKLHGNANANRQQIECNFKKRFGHLPNLFFV
jgi:hypothetical protein